MKKLISIIGFLAVLVILMGYIFSLYGQINTAGRYIENINLNCIVLRKESPIKDLQEWFNKQGDERYVCGDEDGIPGPKLRKAAHNWTCDYAAEPYFKEQSDD